MQWKFFSVILKQYLSWCKNIGTDPKLITEGRAKNYTVARGKQKQMSLLV